VNETDTPGGRTERIVLWLLALPVLVFLVAPVVIVIIVSFSSSGYLQFPPPSLSLQWHQRFWTSGAWRQSTVVSLQLAAAATVLATSFGVAAATGLTRGRFAGRGLIYALLLSPTIIPTIITAIGYFFLARKLRLVGTVSGMAIGEAILALPVVVIIVTATLRGFDRRLEQAALSLGAGHWYVFRRITLPLIAPGVVSAALFAFLAAFDDLLIPLFLGGVRVQTLTVRIWSGLQVELDTTIAAVSAFFVALTSAVLGISALLTRRRS
jgi:putative spermidine/putrescine transport system permease protein